MDKEDPGDIQSLKTLGEKAGIAVHAEYQKGRVRSLSLFFSEHSSVGRIFLPLYDRETSSYTFYLPLNVSGRFNG